MSAAGTWSWPMLAPAVPEMFLGAAICVVLLFDVVADAPRRRWTPMLTFALLAIGAWLTARYALVEEPVHLFGQLYVADRLAGALKLASFLLVALALLYARPMLEAKGMLRGEFFVLALTALLGICVIVSASGLLTLYLGIELLALSQYAMVAFHRESGVAAESAMKYFVLGAIASGFLLFGMSMIYGLTGSLLFTDLATRLGDDTSLGLILGVVFVVVGVAFKFGGAPFHMWVPDVYHGAPAPVGVFIATTPKIASFAMAFRLLSQGLGGQEAMWTQMLAIVAVLSLLLGNIVAIAQTNLKRLLAYSTIGNVGFILLGFVAGTEQGYQAALFYTLVYILMVLGSFGVVLLASRGAIEAEELDDYRGLQARDPMLALAMLFLMFSTAGVPPFVGFWAKLQILQALWASGFSGLVILAAAVSVVGAFYYLRVVKIMYFDPPTTAAAGAAGYGLRWIMGVNALAVLLLGLVPGALLDWCTRLLTA
ncbi:MAG: NADH-quinone oxidoreductase subunit NuoN [Steroidobacteraceae bacterium]|nr:NADH-quinone oxidoreductase subunit NuoN [Steroidobacteraceae bacterium]MDW8259846.1 NADH-quinone oxidoreductase subunit NuoN [Gammaproteobacteria bacterium]